jgi:hypothetical protein
VLSTQAICNRTDPKDHHGPGARLRQRAAEERDDRAEIRHIPGWRDVRFTGNGQIERTRHRNIELQRLILNQAVSPIVKRRVVADAGAEDRQHHFLAQLWHSFFGGLRTAKAVENS